MGGCPHRIAVLAPRPSHSRRHRSLPSPGSHKHRFFSSNHHHHRVSRRSRHPSFPRTRRDATSSSSSAPCRHKTLYVVCCVHPTQQQYSNSLAVLTIPLSADPQEAGHRWRWSVLSVYSSHSWRLPPGWQLNGPPFATLPNLTLGQKR